MHFEICDLLFLKSAENETCVLDAKKLPRIKKRNHSSKPAAGIRIKRLRKTNSDIWKRAAEQYFGLKIREHRNRYNKANTNKNVQKSNNVLEPFAWRILWSC